MKKKVSFTLNTEEIKAAIQDYLQNEEQTTLGKIEGFGINQSSEDIRVFTCWIAFEETIE